MSLEGTWEGFPSLKTKKQNPTEVNKFLVNDTDWLFFSWTLGEEKISLPLTSVLFKVGQVFEYPRECDRLLPGERVEWVPALVGVNASFQFPWSVLLYLVGHKAGNRKVEGRRVLDARGNLKARLTTVSNTVKCDLPIEIIVLESYIF